MAFSSRSSGILRSCLSRLYGRHQEQRQQLAHGARFMSSAPSCKLFVGGIAWTVNEDSLRQAFSAYGEVSEVKIVLDRETGRSKGFGFVSYTSITSAEDAVKKMNNQVLSGRTIRVDYAVEKPPMGRAFGSFGTPSGGAGLNSSNTSSTFGGETSSFGGSGSSPFRREMPFGGGSSTSFGEEASFAGSSSSSFERQSGFGEADNRSFGGSHLGRGGIDSTFGGNSSLGGGSGGLESSRSSYDGAVQNSAQTSLGSKPYGQDYSGYGGVGNSGPGSGFAAGGKSLSGSLGHDTTSFGSGPFGQDSFGGSSYGSVQSSLGRTSVGGGSGFVADGRSSSGSLGQDTTSFGHEPFGQDSFGGSSYGSVQSSPGHTSMGGHSGFVAGGRSSSGSLGNDATSFGGEPPRQDSFGSSSNLDVQSSPGHTSMGGGQSSPGHTSMSGKSFSQDVSDFGAGGSSSSFRRDSSVEAGCRSSSDAAQSSLGPSTNSFFQDNTDPALDTFFEDTEQFGQDNSLDDTFGGGFEFGEVDNTLGSPPDTETSSFGGQASGYDNSALDDIQSSSPTGRPSHDIQSSIPTGHPPQTRTSSGSKSHDMDIGGISFEPKFDSEWFGFR